MPHQPNTALTDAPDEIRIRLGSPAEMFTPPSPDALTPSAADAEPDGPGRWRGESGCERALRLLADRPHARTLVVRLEGGSAEEHDLLRARVRAWCAARILGASQEIRLTRRLGLRTLIWSLALLGVSLALSWGLQAESVLGPPGPLRAVFAEALVIAGWVMMWRPIELLFCDPMRPAYERRLLRALRGLEWRFEP